MNPEVGWNVVQEIICSVFSSFVFYCIIYKIHTFYFDPFYIFICLNSCPSFIKTVLIALIFH